MSSKKEEEQVSLLDSEEKSLERYIKTNKNHIQSRIPQFITIMNYFFFINLLYCFALLFGYLRPVFYKSYKRICFFQSEMSVFLDMFVTLCFLAQGSFFKDVVLREDFESIKFVVLFGSGFLIFWTLMELNEYLVYYKNSDCIFLNLMEFVVFKIIEVDQIFYGPLVCIQIVLYVMFVSSVLWFLNKKKNTNFKIPG